MHRIRGDWAEAVAQVRRRLLLQDASLAALGPLRLLKLSAEQSADQIDAAAMIMLAPLRTTVPEILLQLAAGLGRRQGFSLASPRAFTTRRERRALMAAALVFCLALGWRFLPSPQAEASVEPDAVMVQRAESPALDSKAEQKLLREVSATNRAVRELNLPVDAVFAALSPHALKDVALLGIDITSASEGKARVTAAAKSLEGMQDYLQSLERRPDLRAVTLLHHEEGEGSDWHYRFTVEAVWQQP